MKVVATKEYQVRGIEDSELKRIPQEGDVFEVSEDRFNLLSGNNKYGSVFVKEYVESNEEDTTNEDEEQTDAEDNEEVPTTKVEKKAILKVDKEKNNVKKSVLQD